MPASCVTLLDRVIVSPMEKALKIENLHKSYAGVAAVKNLDLEIEQGEIFGLLGPNGAGKSTIINMISGVSVIDSGRISAFGYDNRSQYRQTRRMLGVVHQEIVIDNFFTIEQALKMHAGYYGVEDDEPWRNELIDRLDLRPHLDKVMIKLSGGMKRRFMIAKALIHRPRLLILDEPTAGVDVELRHGLWDFVREINQRGTTILLTTHYLEEAEEMCGRIAIMNYGELVALEPTRDLVRRLSRRTLRLWLTRALAAVPAGLDAYHPRINGDGRQLVLCLPTEQGVGDLLHRLSELHLGIDDFETDQSHLEDVFLQLTREDRKG